jgi:hypothetical protein
LIENGLRLVHANPPCPFARDGQTLQHLALKAAAEALGCSDPAVPACGRLVSE